MTSDPNPIRTHLALYAYVLKLAVKALGRKFPYLLAGPFVLVALALAEQLIPPMGLASGIIHSIVRAAAVSLLLFAGRAIIEQRSLELAHFTEGLGAFFGDVMTVYFALWIVSMILGNIAPPIFLVVWAAVYVLPVFEVVALAPAGGFANFGAAWSFIRRDALPWLVGQLPVVALFGTFAALFLGLGRLLPPATERFAVPVLLGLALLIAYVYRGILFLTLDGTSPYQRAQKFGGAPSLR